MAESLTTRLLRLGFNFFPAYRGSGARLTYIAHDFREVRVAVPLSWRTRNYVGTIFGGSMYAAVDPVYMLMLIKNLGPDYVVWDKAAHIRFRKPGRTTLHARFLLTAEELATIRDELTRVPVLDRHYEIALTDEAGVVHASVQKTVHIRRKHRRGDARETSAAKVG